jgi:hypothetical protein
MVSPELEPTPGSPGPTRLYVEIYATPDSMLRDSVHYGLRREHDGGAAVFA